MILERTNIESKLRYQQSKSNEEVDIIKQVKVILNSSIGIDKRILKEISSKEEIHNNTFNIDVLETDKIYHLSTIKSICVDYRLRFLNARYFKSDMPSEAIEKIKKLEAEHAIQLKGFKIMAPSKLFKLNKTDDPLLFAPIGNDYYYLIHTWGNDLHPLRKWLMLPFRNFESLALTTLLVSFLATFLIPNGLFSKQTSSSEFWMLFFFMFKSIAAIVIFYGFALGKNFNIAIWNNKYNKA